MSFMSRRKKYREDPDFNFFVQSLVRLLSQYDFNSDEASEILQCADEVYAQMKGEVIISEDICAKTAKSGPKDRLRSI